MQRVHEIISEIDNLDLSSEARRSLRDELLTLAATDESAFCRIVRAVPLSETDKLYDIYESLSADSRKWSEFLMDEMDRLLNVARTAETPAGVLKPLEALLLLANENAEIDGEMCRRLVGYLDSPIVSIRRLAASLSGGFVSTRDGYLIDRLRALLRDDSDWRVRAHAYHSLRDNQLLPGEFSRPILDRLRARIMDEFAI